MPVSAPCFVLWFPPSFLPRTVIFRYHLCAFFTLHCTAPVKFAVAAADDLDALLDHSEAAVIAQSAAALFLPRRQVLIRLHTLPALGAMDSQALVLGAVIRRIFQENELRLRDAPKSVRNGSSVVCAIASLRRFLVHLQLLGLFVLFLQVVAHLPEVGQLHPAGLDAAAPRHSVTLTGFPHGGFDCLRERQS